MNDFIVVSRNTNMSKHGRWSEECLKTAVAAAKNGSSVRSAANASGIPKKTLADYVKRGTDIKGPLHTLNQMVNQAVNHLVSC